ncbi:MAG: YbdD/YjiX family protein [Rhodospirillaceae bacterium]|nr:YbdD/YjiX family protein [Rhodospirillaceae bacterium]
MCGVPDYDTYVAHMKNKHPDQEAMDYKAFFENRMNARFGGSSMKACC